MPKKPDFSFEKRYWKKGYQIVIGVDEVGRGAFAGAVVAVAAALNRFKIYDLRFKSRRWRDSAEAGNKKVRKSSIVDLTSIINLGINDSKKLSPQKRVNLVPAIRKYFYWGIGQSSVSTINRLGIVKATEKAMRRAISHLLLKLPKRLKKLNGKTFLFVDAFHVKYIPEIGLKRQKAIIKGDNKSISIAAASILAKVHRDRLMSKLGAHYKKYHWHENKGYGTEEHREAIQKFGITKLHRKQYVRNLILSKS